MRNSSGTLDFRLAGPDGPVVKVPMSELVLPLYLANRTPIEQQWPWLNSVFYDDGLRAESCLFAVGKVFDASKSKGPPSPYPAPFCLGDPFLRAAYMVFDVANKEFGIAQSNPDPTVSSVVRFAGASAKIPLATPGPPLREPTSATQTLAKPRPTLAAASGFLILRNREANGASPSDAGQAASSHARHLALGLGIGIPMGLLALALAVTCFRVMVLRYSLQCCGLLPTAKHGDDNAPTELEATDASLELAEVHGASRVYELSATSTELCERMHPLAAGDASQSQTGDPDAGEDVSPITYRSLSPRAPKSVSP